MLLRTNLHLECNPWPRGMICRIGFLSPCKCWKHTHTQYSDPGPETGKSNLSHISYSLLCDFCILRHEHCTPIPCTGHCSNLSCSSFSYWLPFFLSTEKILNKIGFTNTNTGRLGQEGKSSTRDQNPLVTVQNLSAS